MYDAGEALQLALRLREQFETPGEMLAAMRAHAWLSDDAAFVVGTLADHATPDSVAWLAAIFYAAGRIDKNTPALRVQAYEVYSTLGVRRRSAT